MYAAVNVQSVILCFKEENQFDLSRNIYTLGYMWVSINHITVQ